MAYTKTTWSAGDTVTSEKLNKIEQGIYDASSGGNSSGGGVFYIEIESEYDSVNDIETTTFVNNVTGQQILDAINNGMIVAEKISMEYDGVPGTVIGYLVSHTIKDEMYCFRFNGSLSFDLCVSSLSENLAIAGNGGEK